MVLYLQWTLAVEMKQRHRAPATPASWWPHLQAFRQRFLASAEWREFAARHELSEQPQQTG